MSASVNSLDFPYVHRAYPLTTFDLISISMRYMGALVAQLYHPKEMEMGIEFFRRNLKNSKEKDYFWQKE